MPFSKLMPMQERMSAIRRQFFLLIVYSLTSAATMGSSIGLVLYQSHQFRFLHSHPPVGHPSSAHAPPSLASTTASSTSTSTSTTTTTTSPHLVLLRLLPSIWLPLLLWACSLALASSLCSQRRGWIPKHMSARTGMLVSQGMFAIFWILLGCMQQVQEAMRASLMAQDPIAVMASPPTYLAPTSPFPSSSRFSDDPLTITVTTDMESDPRAFWRAARVPLWIVWHMAVVLLGLSTGLLTSCAQQLEQALQAAACTEESSLLLFQKQGSREVDEKGHLMMDLEPTPHPHLISSSSSSLDNNRTAVTTTSANAWCSPLLSRGQHVVLLGWLVVLLASQVWVFQWMAKAQADDRVQHDHDHSPSHHHHYHQLRVEMSSALTTVGLFFGVAMMVVGARLLPTMPSQTRSPNSFTI